MKTLKLLGLTLLVSGSLAGSAIAQGSLSADVVSAYVWRGLPQSNASVQPGFSYSLGGLSLGYWASYSLDSFGVVENDFYASYTLALSEGHELSLGVTDYYYPGGGNFGWFETDGNGAHTIEAAVGYSGPVNVLLAVNVWNDPDNSVYAEVGVPVEGEGFTYTYFAGIATGKAGGWYVKFTDKLALINIGFSAEKTIKINDTFEIPVKAVFGINPDAEVSYITFGFTF